MGAVDTDEGFVPVVRGAVELRALFKATRTVFHAVAAADETSDNRGEMEVRKYLFRRAEERFEQLKLKLLNRSTYRPCPCRQCQRSVLSGHGQSTLHLIPQDSQPVAIEFSGIRSRRCSTNVIVLFL